MGVAGRPTKPMFEITSGLPYRRRVVVEGARLVWPALADLEVRSQVRKSKSVTSDLVFDLTPHLTVTYEGDDIAVALDLTGAQTRLVKPGYFDLILSDAGTEDGRAIRALRDQVLSVDDLITAAS